ncbi:MAG: 50S ribosomal protein L29 [Chloroflexota bacterium]
MKADQARALSDIDLHKELEASRRELFNLRLRVATKQLANNREVSKTKRKVARLQTIIRERQLSA